VQTSNPHQDIIRWQFSAEQLKDAELVARLVQRIAIACDLRNAGTNLQLIVVELINNALDHGVLKLSSDLKAEPNGFTRYYKERERRLNDLHSGWVEVTIEVTAAETLCLRVHDSGDGFDYRGHWAQLAVQPGSVAHRAATDDTYGRGLIILKDLCDQVVHVGCGNEVVVEVRLDTLRTRQSEHRLPGIESA
jgi:anti-sigma regulatory factor (Ser/Thr protein kinase)